MQSCIRFTGLTVGQPVLRSIVPGTFSFSPAGPIQLLPLFPSISSSAAAFCGMEEGRYMLPRRGARMKRKLTKAVKGLRLHHYIMRGNEKARELSGVSGDFRDTRYCIFFGFFL